MNACLLQASRVGLARCQAVLEVPMLCDSRRKSGLQQDGSQPVALTTKGQSMHKTLLGPSIPCDENEEMAANFLFSVTVVAACDSAGRPAAGV